MKREINQSWQIAFGEGGLVSKKDLCIVKNITIRNIWLEDTFIYNAIKAFKSEELFHPPEMYCLKWQPLGSYHQLIIPLADCTIQESVINEISRMKKSSRKKLIFYFVTLLPDMKLFAERVHPAALVKFDSKNAVLKKISEMFLEGKIPISELQQIFTCDYSVWKISLYNLLPSDWKEYHEYLNEQPEAEVTETDIEKKYLNEEITLREYEDFKYPERKELNDIKSLQYPLPPEYSVCIICGEENIGIIPCQNCNNKACVHCVRSNFLNDESGEGSFMLMHHKYCLRLGSLKPIKLEIKQEPAYLRFTFLKCRLIAIFLSRLKHKNVY